MYQSKILLRKRSSFSKANFSLAAMLFFSSLLFITSCEEAGFVGLEIQPPSERFVLKTHHDLAIQTSIWKRDSLLAIHYSRSLVGAVDDPLFGRSRTSFMTQLGIERLGYRFGTEPVVERLELKLRVTAVYGDQLSPPQVNIYELGETIDAAEGYHTNLDPWPMVKENGLLTTHTLDLPGTDSIITIPITSNIFRNKLLFAPDSVMLTLGQFLGYFRGLYVTTSQTGQSGAIYTFNLNHVDSELSLYYTTPDVPDSILRYDYIINEFANRVNLFEHDYSTAVFYNDLEQTGTDDPVFYVQGGSGVMGRLDLEYLHAWRDSMPVSINSAHLVFPVENTGDFGTFPLPPRLTLLERGEDGALYGLVDLALGDDFFGGRYNADLGQYRINITNFVHSFLKGGRDNNSVYVSVRDSGMIPGRAVLRNRNHHSGGVRLEITYTTH
jgi:hypothetical protein